MYAEPIDLDRRELSATLRTTWGLRVSSMRYQPVGFGSHHYVAHDENGARWFVTVDALDAKSWLGSDPDAAFDGLDRAFRTAVTLRRQGLEFVHAPVESSDGTVLVRLGQRYAVSTFAFVEGTSNPFGEHTSMDERRRVLRSLGRLHAATDALPTALPRRDTLAVPLRGSLLKALDNLASTWTGGPFSELARHLLADREGSVRGLLGRYDELAGLVTRSSDGWVVTHGEPHAANVMRTPGGSLVLIDWDTVAVGPRERDLWMVEPRDAEDWSAYTAAAAAPPPDPTAMDLYRLSWTLAEIAIYTDTFRSPHEDDANTRAAWTGLKSHAPGPSSP